MEYDVLGYGLQRCASRFGVPFLRFGQFVVDRWTIYKTLMMLQKALSGEVDDFIQQRFIYMVLGQMMNSSHSCSGFSSRQHQYAALLDM